MSEIGRKLPRSALVIAFASSALAIYALFIGLWPALIYFYGFLVGFPDDSYSWNFTCLGTWVSVGLAGIVSVWLLLKRTARGPGWTLAFLVVAVGMILPRLSEPSLDIWDRIGLPTPSPLDIIVLGTGRSIPHALAFTVALSLVAWVGKVLLFETQTRLACNASLEDRMGFASRKRPMISFLLALGLGMLLPYLFSLVSLGLDSFFPNGWAWPWPGLGSDLLSSLPFVSAVCILFARRTEHLFIDEDGVNLFLFRRRYSIFRFKWARVRYVDIIRHGNGPATFVIHYRSRIWLPFSFGVHPDRYVDPDKVVIAMLGNLDRYGVRTREWSSSKAVLAAGALAMMAGALLIWYGQNMSSTLAQQYTDGIISAYDIARFAALRPLTTAYLAAGACIGMGFGLHSAYHRGGPRPILLALLLCGAGYIPDPLLHWLVAIAMFAILTATTGVPIYLHPPLLQMPTVPSLTEWEFYMGLVKYSPAVIGAAYVLGVVLGRWPWRLIRYPRLNRHAAEASLAMDSATIGS